MTEFSETTPGEFSKTQRRSIACGLLTGVVFVSAVVLARRVSGDASPITAWAACLVGSLAMAIAVLCAIVPGVLREQMQVSDRILATGLASIPGVLLGLSLLPAGSVAGVGSLLGIYFVAVISATLAGELPQWSLAVGDAHARRVYSGHGIGHSVPISAESVQNKQPLVAQSLRKTAVSLAGNSESLASAELSGSDREELEAAIETEPPRSTWPSAFPTPDNALDESGIQHETVAHPSENPQTTQWMSRSLTSEGESVEGGCQANFEPGQKIVAVHIPFTPAFDSVPEFECEPLDDSDVKIKISSRHRYGIRIEVTRNGVLTGAQSIPLGWFAFAATAPTAENIAA